MSLMMGTTPRLARGPASSPLVGAVVPARRGAARQALRPAATAEPGTVSKKELVKIVAGKAGITQMQADAALNGLLDTIVDTVAKGHKVEIKGFGSFQPRKMAARTGRNLVTGEAMQIPESVTATFHAGKTFKDTVKAAHK